MRSGEWSVKSGESLVERFGSRLDGRVRGRSAVLEGRCVPEGCTEIAAYAAVGVHNSDPHGLTPTATCCRGYAAL